MKVCETIKKKYIYIFSNMSTAMQIYSETQRRILTCKAGIIKLDKARGIKRAKARVD